MKVKEAIKLLQSMDQKTDVYLDFGLKHPIGSIYPSPKYMEYPSPTWVGQSYPKFNEITCLNVIH